MADVLVEAPSIRMSAVNWVEAAIVIDQRKDPIAIARLEEVLETLRVEVVAVAPSTAVEARLAYQRFGRGNHRAHLNFGDTFAYALARESGEPLLFKGDDFGRTDVEPALKPE